MITIFYLFSALLAFNTGKSLQQIADKEADGSYGETEYCHYSKPPLEAFVACWIFQYLTKLLNTETEQFRPLLNGERFITDPELAGMLKLTSRTLVEHRISGLLPYYKLGGKILYKESDIIKVLENNRLEAFEK